MQLRQIALLLLVVAVPGASASPPRILYVRTVQEVSLWDQLTQPARRLMQQVCSPFLGQRDLGQMRLEPDLASHASELKREFEELLQTPFMAQWLESWAQARQVGPQGLSDRDASTIVVAIHDCLLDRLQVGPSVIPAGGYFSGWFLALSTASLPNGSAQPESLFLLEQKEAHIPERVIAHELMHGLMSDALDDAHRALSIGRKIAVRHDSGLTSDMSQAFWEGFAEAAEAVVGDAFADAHLDSGHPQWSFLAGRQKPIRDNAYAFQLKAPRQLREREDLLRTEGFLATYNYRLMTRYGWTLTDLARVLAIHQPIQSAQWIAATTQDPQHRDLRREYLEMSRFITYVPQAQHLFRLLTAAQAELQETGSRTAEDRLDRLSRQWVDLTNHALDTAMRADSNQLVRLAGNL